MKSTISPEYLEMNRKLHSDKPEYGTTSGKNATFALHFARAGKHTTVLDFGCGKGLLKPALAQLAPDLSVLEYDPAIEGKDVLPSSPVDLIVAMDVMEHIEPEYLESVLQQLHDLRSKEVLFIIDKLPATKTLPDGRNAHLIQRPGKWWRSKITKHFKRTHTDESDHHYLFLGSPL